LRGHEGKEEEKNCRRGAVKETGADQDEKALEKVKA